MEKMEGVETTEKETPIPPLLNEDERRILDVYDRLEELQLEIALLQAQGVLSKVPQDASENDIAAAEQELLKAKSHYLLRSNVIESVLIAPPILQAVHAGDKATVVEQDLFPLIQKRDQLATKLTQLSTEARSARDELTKVEVENAILVRHNAELATTMLALAEEADTQRKEDIQDPELRHQLDELEAEMKRSRQKWRIMKGTASAIIAGSGVDWARNPDLLDIVLDNEGE
ncbi:hypothetical protein LZ554_005002 [Drepanopeziza brunnea f. sp. 'monogermtubi']|nr:hypothetical protein LZ554_005002 [Drepanopeziza brunnea f. sp. 'monogermtubi']